MLPVICLMGPTASGKTDAAIALQNNYPVRIISVDSAMVYRGMDIGTAKPDAETLAIAPHALVDIREPEQGYSVGNFVADACSEIESAIAANEVPLLVGGTMLYFRALIHGLADLPEADIALRKKIDDEAAVQGWPHMHRRLAEVDPVAAARINQNDRQRIQRALEVHEISGSALTDLHRDAAVNNQDYQFIKLALVPDDRAVLHERIRQRFDLMLDQGFEREVATLMQRPQLNADSAAMRAVGYRQMWAHLQGERDMERTRQAVLAATRQLAKRQLTWLRSERDLLTFDPLEKPAIAAMSAAIAKQMDE